MTSSSNIGAVMTEVAKNDIQKVDTRNNQEG